MTTTAKLPVLFALLAVAVMCGHDDAQAMSDYACKKSGGLVKWNGAHLKLCCQRGDKVLYCEQAGSNPTLGKRKQRALTNPN